MSASGGKQSLGPVAAFQGSTTPGVTALLEVVGSATGVSSVAAPSTLQDGATTQTEMLSAMVYGATGGSNSDRLRTPNVFKTISVVAVGAETTIWTPAGGKKFRLMGAYLGLSAADRLSLKDNTGGTLIFIGLLPAAAGALITFGNGILSAAANNVLTAQSGAAANLTGVVFGTEE